MERKIGNVCISSVYVREKNFKDYRYTAYKAASDLGYDVCRNPEDSGTTQENFENYMKNMRPVFILLVGNVASDVVQKECQLALSLGLPIITLLRTTTKNKISNETQQIMRSISEVTFQKSCSCFQNCEDLYDSVQKRLIEYEKESKRSIASCIPQHSQIYTKSTEIIGQTKKRIILCQKTSSLLLGPRKGVTIENEFYSKLFQWIANADKNMEFLHFFSFSETKAALSSQDYDLKTAQKKLLNLFKRKGLEICPIIRYVDNSITPCMICDNTLLVPLSIGKLEYNLYLPHYVMDGTSISRIVADLQIMGNLLYSHESPSIDNIVNFYC